MDMGIFSLLLVLSYCGWLPSGMALDITDLSNRFVKDIAQSGSKDYKPVIIKQEFNTFKIENLARDILLINAGKFSSTTMKGIQRMMLEVNERCIYIIDGVDFDLGKTNYIMGTIRQFDKTSPIVVLINDHFPNIYQNLFIVIPEKEEFIVYQSCRFCHGKRKGFNEVNSYSQKKGFHNKINLAPSFRESFGGLKLRIAYAEAFGILYKAGVDHLGKPIWGGSAYEMLSLMARKLDFQIDLIESPDKTVGTDVNGKPTGMLWLVANDKADIGIEFLAAHIRNFIHADFSSPYYYSEMVILSDMPPRGLKAFSFLRTFQGIVWVSFGVCILLTMVTLYLCDRLSGSRGLFFQNCWEIAKIVLWDTTCIRPESNSKVVLMSVFLILNMMVMNAFMAILTSFLTAEPNIRDPIESLSDCKRQNLKWLGPKGSDRIQVDPWKKASFQPVPFENSLDFVKNALQMIQDNPYSFCFPYLRTAAEGIIQLHFVNQNGQHNFHIGKEPMSPYHIVILMQKGAIYQKVLNRYILRMYEMGISARYIEETLVALGKIGRQMARMRNDGIIKLKKDIMEMKHLKGPAWILGLGFTTSLLILCIEIFYNFVVLQLS